MYMYMNFDWASQTLPEIQRVYEAITTETTYVTTTDGMERGGVRGKEAGMDAGAVCGHACGYACVWAVCGAVRGHA